MTLEKYLKDCRFDKYLKKLVKNLTGKSVIVYGTGLLFDTITDKYDLSELNIIGISDIRYYSEEEGNLDYGYKIIPRDSLKNYSADVILVGTKEYTTLIKKLKATTFCDCNVEIIPLVKKNLFVKLKKIFLNK